MCQVSSFVSGSAAVSAVDPKGCVAKAALEKFGLIVRLAMIKHHKSHDYDIKSGNLSEA
jgi:hypothetical protein